MTRTEKSTIIIREGCHSDNVGLVGLTSLAPMDGKVSIRVDRRPDFFGLLKMRGSSFVIVAEVNNNIIGSYSVSEMKVFIDGEPEKVYYLGDFKVHPDYRKSTVALGLTKAVIQKLHSLNAELIFGTVVSGNKTVNSFLKGSLLWSPAEAVGKFNVYQIIPLPFKGKNTKYQVKECVSDLYCAELFNNFIKKFQLGPMYCDSSFENSTLLTASLDTKVVAAISLVDVSAEKQDVLVKIPFYLKSLVSLVNMAHNILPIVSLPHINEEVKVLYIKSFACEPENEDALRMLLSKARNLAHDKGYHFLTIGIHEKNPWKKIFSHYPKFQLQSNLYVFNMKTDTTKINSVVNGIPFVDYSWV